MRATEVVLVAGAGAIATLRSPAARAVAGRVIGRSAQAARPAAARASRAAIGRARATRVRLTQRTPGGPVACPRGDGCEWTQDTPGAAELLAHLHQAHGRGAAAPAPDPPVPAPRRPSPGPKLAPVRDDRPQERITRVADGVYIGHQIDQIIDRIGLHMDEFRAVSRALNAAGEIEPTRLLELLTALAGVQTTMAGVANLINDLTEYADTEMHVDLRALGMLYEAAGSVLSETASVRKAMETIRRLYAEEIAVEEKEDEGTVRKLNPNVVRAAA